MAGQGMSSRAHRAKLAVTEMLMNLQFRRGLVESCWSWRSAPLMLLPITSWAAGPRRPSAKACCQGLAIRLSASIISPPVVAVGCIAAMHSAGAGLVVAFIVAMMAGVALHLSCATVPAAEILVALSVIALGR